MREVQYTCMWWDFSHLVVLCVWFISNTCRLIIIISLGDWNCYINTLTFQPIAHKCANVLDELSERCMWTLARSLLDSKWDINSQFPTSFSLAFTKCIITIWFQPITTNWILSLFTRSHKEFSQYRCVCVLYNNNKIAAANPICLLM